MPKINKLAKARSLAVSGAAAAAVALPLALISTPAHASTVKGCSVVPLTPVRVAGTTATVRFDTRITCPKDRIVRVKDERRELDGLDGSNLYGTSTYVRTFEAAGTKTVPIIAVVTNTESGAEEVFHRTAFLVADINGVSSSWTPFQDSGRLSVSV